MEQLPSSETLPKEAPASSEFAPAAEMGTSRKKALRRQARIGSLWALITLIAFLSGLGGGYWLGSGKLLDLDAPKAVDPASLTGHIHPSGGYRLPATYGNIGPQLLAVGAIDPVRFGQVYEQASQPLTDAQQSILREGSDEQIVIDSQNARFLLNFFWALGLANQNRILTEGPMVENGQDKITSFASTGGWTLATKPVAQLYASAPMVQLSSEQQARLENVSRQVYRPCCDNPTHFPDCNHGMAMLGLLELLASQDAGEDQMFEAAKYANAYWYPQQSAELAAYFQATQKVDFAEVDARQLLNAQHSSGSGFRSVHQWLVANGALEQAPGGGSSCGV